MRGEGERIGWREGGWGKGRCREGGGGGDWGGREGEYIALCLQCSFS